MPPDTLNVIADQGERITKLETQVQRLCYALESVLSAIPDLDPTVAYSVREEIARVTKEAT